MERQITPVEPGKARDTRPESQPEPVDVLKVLEVALDPKSTSAAKADVLKQVREARERARRDRPQQT